MGDSDSGKHSCPHMERERFVSVVRREGHWCIWIHCNDDMDDIYFRIRHCPWCGKTLTAAPEKT